MDSIISSVYWPFMILLLAVVAVVLMISRLKIHPFIALMLAAIFVGLLSADLPSIEGMNPMVAAVELPMREFGIVAGKISWVIALAAIIGVALMKSGAAERIVAFLLQVFGEQKAAIALLLAGFILSIPVFFDTVFFLLIPLAITLAVKTGKNFVLYVVAIAGGAVVTHILVPPTPGPLIMAETLGIDLGITIVAGLLLGILPAMSTLYVGRKMDARLNIPIRVEASLSNTSSSPNLLLSTLPVLIPILLISLASVVSVLAGNLPGWLAFFGNKNIAMGLGAAVALWLWVQQNNLDASSLWEGIVKPLEIAGLIILITSAGGAFGAMIKHSGIGDAIEMAMSHFHIHYVLLAWLISAVMKTAQGSSTVAMITSASIMTAIIGTGADLTYHPIYILVAIGFGSGFISWMNDSGFWVVSRMSGFTEKEALSTWTLMFAVVSLVGLIEALVLSYLFPLV